MQWLDTYTLKSGACVDELARRVYTRLAADLKEYGTGTVLLFGRNKVGLRFLPFWVNHSSISLA